MAVHSSRVGTCIAVVFVMLISNEVSATSSQVDPSEYAYHNDMVYRSERSSANCRRYASGLDDIYSAFSENYIHCDGTQLRLTDSDFGSQQYNSSDYYVWLAGSSASQLLFIFPSRVNLTTITLHYYSSDGRGLSRLRFFAVPDDFDVWEALSASYSHVDVAAVAPSDDGRPAGRRNVSVNFNFNTRKILLYKFRSSYAFVLSEVEYFTNTGLITTSSPNSPTTTMLPQMPTTIPNTTDTTPTITAQMSTTKEFLLDASVTTSSASGINLKDPTVLTWLLIALVLVFTLVDGALDVDNSVMEVCSIRQTKATDRIRSEVNLSQCRIGPHSPEVNTDPKE